MLISCCEVTVLIGSQMWLVSVPGPAYTFILAKELYFVHLSWACFSSVLWHCWLGVRKSIWLVKACSRHTKVCFVISGVRCMATIIRLLHYFFIASVDMASNRSCCLWHTKYSQPPNFCTCITSSLFSLLTELAVHTDLDVHLWSLLLIHLRRPDY